MVLLGGSLTHEIDYWAVISKGLWLQQNLPEGFAKKFAMNSTCGLEAISGSFCAFLMPFWFDTADVTVSYRSDTFLFRSYEP